MTPAHSIKFCRNRQQGSSLIESLITMLLLTVLGLGLTYVSSRMLAEQRYTSTQSLSIIHMREYLQTRADTHKNFALADIPVQVKEQLVRRPVTVFVEGIPSEKTLPMAAVGIALSVRNQELYSGDGTLIVSHGIAAAPQ